jgi:hypothetical protein
MATKGLLNPFNICYANVPSTVIDAAGTVTAGPAKDYYFQSSRVYEDPTVAARTGIKLVPADNWEGEEPLIKVEQMVLSRKLVRLVAEYSTTTGANKTMSILVARSKVGDILSDDKTKNLDGLNVLNNKGTNIGKFFNVRTSTRNSFS